MWGWGRGGEEVFDGHEVSPWRKDVFWRGVSSTVLHCSSKTVVKLGIWVISVYLTAAPQNKSFFQKHSTVAGVQTYHKCIV